MNNKLFYIVVALCILVGGGYYFVKDKNGVGTKEPEPVFCTMDAKLCPDGSYVGRSGPLCEFEACPVVSEATEAKLNEQILNNGVYITPKEIVEDSRCATDVVCIWAGQVRLKVNLKSLASSDSPVTGDVILTTNKPFLFNGQTIELVRVLPAPNSQKTIAVNEYLFTFKVGKK